MFLTTHLHRTKWLTIFGFLVFIYHVKLTNMANLGAKNFHSSPKLHAAWVYDLLNPGNAKHLTACSIGRRKCLDPRGST